MKIIHAVSTALYVAFYVANGLWFAWIFISEAYREGWWTLINPFFDFQLTLNWLFSWITWVGLGCAFLFFYISNKTAPPTVGEAP